MAADPGFRYVKNAKAANKGEVKVKPMTLLFVLGFTSSSVLAGPVEDAKAAFDKGDVKTAVRIVREAAERGDLEAQASLGELYWSGRGVQQDYTEGTRWIRRAAERNYARAQYNLGVSYRDGLGNAKDDTEAFHWFLKAADQGLAAAQHNVASRYLAGRTVQKDEEAAVKLFRKAAEQGWAPSMAALGKLYSEGQGVRRDAVEAYKWLILADNGSWPARQRDELHAEQKQVASAMTQSEIERALRLARAWTPTTVNADPAYVKPLDAQKNAVAVSEGQRFDLASYAVAAPPGTGWNAVILPDRTGITFIKSDPLRASNVIAGILRQDIDAKGGGESENEVVANIQRAEEAGYRSRGSSRLYSIGDISKGTVEVGGKRLYRMVLTISDESRGYPVRSKAAGYIYLPSSWKQSRRDYLLVIEQTPVESFTMASADEVVAAILASLRETSGATSDPARWEQLSNANCTVWNTNPQPEETISWSGACLEGKADGRGTELDRYLESGASKEERFEGEMRKGKFQGRGVLYYADGSRFEGVFDDGEKVSGSLFHPGGARYDGTFANGVFDGKGKFTYADGSYFAGDFKRGLPNGSGTLQQHGATLFRAIGSMDACERGNA